MSARALQVRVHIVPVARIRTREGGGWVLHRERPPPSAPAPLVACACRGVGRAGGEVCWQRAGALAMHAFESERGLQELFFGEPLA